MGHEFDFNLDALAWLALDQDAMAIFAGGGALVPTNVTSYDNIGRPQSLLDANGGLTQFFYNVNSQLTGLMDPVGNLTQWLYDAAGNRVQEIDPLGNSKFFNYNAKSEVIRITDRNGRIREFGFDALGRQVLEEWIDNGVVVRTITFAYDSNGNLILATDPDSTYTMTYDELNRMNSIDNLGTPNVPRFILTYEFDNVGNILTVFDNYGVTVSSTYDARNLLATRDWTGPDLDHVRIENFFNELGQEVTSDRSTNGILSVRKESTYDNMNRQDTLTYKNALDEIMSSYDYAYNLRGLVSHLDYTSQAITGTQESDYNYDPTGQILNALYNGWQPDEHFNWDLNGNPVGPDYVIGPGNRLLETPTHLLEYDLEGNLVKQTDKASGEYWIYERDHRNRLIRATKYSAGGVILDETSQISDVFNRRITRETNGVVEHSVHDGQHLWADVSSNGMANVRYLYGAIIDEALARQSPGEGTILYVTDHLGSVRDLVNAGGVIINHVIYSAFGTPVVKTNPLAGGRLLFTAREYNPVTQLYDYRSREMDPRLRRFLEEDRAGFLAGDTNLFRYVFNGPAAASDPLGFGIVAGQYGKLLERFKTLKEAIALQKLQVDKAFQLLAKFKSPSAGNFLKQQQNILSEFQAEMFKLVGILSQPTIFIVSKIKK